MPVENVSREKNAPSLSLPQYLESYLQKTPPGAKTLWTYPELATDLSGNSDPARSRIVRELVGELKWPKGSICFWPAFAAGSNHLDIALFAQGLETLQPLSVVVFDGAFFCGAVSAFGDSAVFEDYVGVSVLWLESLEMLRSESSQKDAALARLQAHFANLC